MTFLDDSYFLASMAESTTEGLTSWTISSVENTTTSSQSSPYFHCDKNNIDIVFIVDESTSVSEEKFLKIKKIINSMIDEMRIGPDYYQISLVTFGFAFARIRINLDEYSNKTELQAAIWDTDKGDEQGTRIDLFEALQLAYKKAFTKENGDREEAHNVVLLFTDRMFARIVESDMSVDNLKVCYWISY